MASLLDRRCAHLVRGLSRAVLLALVVAGCGGGGGEAQRVESPSGPVLEPATARPDMVRMLLEDAELERHASDGGGRAWLEAGETAVAGRSGSWTLGYEAGPLGIAEGGMLFLQVDPFWSWSTPQVSSPEAAGYTSVTTEAEGVRLRAETLDQQLLGIRVDGRGLREGERVELVYGAGSRGARADRYAERGARFWFAVDGDGDGVRKILPDSPTVRVRAGPPARLALHLPSSASPGQTVKLAVAVLDGLGNLVEDFGGELLIQSSSPSIGGSVLPDRIALEPADRGCGSVEFPAPGEGVHRLAVGFETELGELVTELSNPMVVEREAAPVLWGDLHGHSNLSDGTGTPEDYFRYARDVAALDVIALTDHDHWGIRFLDRSPDMWAEVREQVRSFHRPGHFVTLLGYEWTSWIHGHRHVLYFEDEGQVHSSIDPSTDDPRELWNALEGSPALTFAHHSAGGPIATNWSFAPDPVLEPVTEIVSVHGSSEAADSPGRIYSPVRGNFVRDVLGAGHRLGFIGSGDGHDGHPGLAHLASPNGGVAAILAKERTRESVLEALRARRVYATNGPRILLRAEIDGRNMGSALPVPAGDGAAQLRFRVVGTDTLRRVDLIRGQEIALSLDPEGRVELAGEVPLEGIGPGDFVYLRAIQEDGGAAWSSPFFFGD